MKLHTEKGTFTINPDLLFTDGDQLFLLVGLHTPPYATYSLETGEAYNTHCVDARDATDGLEPVVS